MACMHFTSLTILKIKERVNGDGFQREDTTDGKRKMRAHHELHNSASINRTITRFFQKESET